MTQGVQKDAAILQARRNALKAPEALFPEATPDFPTKAPGSALSSQGTLCRSEKGTVWGNLTQPLLVDRRIWGLLGVLLVRRPPIGRVPKKVTIMRRSDHIGPCPFVAPATKLEGRHAKRDGAQFPWSKNFRPKKRKVRPSATSQKQLQQQKKKKALLENFNALEVFMLL